MHNIDLSPFLCHQKIDFLFFQNFFRLKALSTDIFTAFQSSRYQFTPFFCRQNHCLSECIIIYFVCQLYCIYSKKKCTYSFITYNFLSSCSISYTIGCPLFLFFFSSLQTLYLVGRVSYITVKSKNLFPHFFNNSYHWLSFTFFYKILTFLFSSKYIFRMESLFTHSHWFSISNDVVSGRKS